MSWRLDNVDIPPLGRPLACINTCVLVDSGGSCRLSWSTCLWYSSISARRSGVGSPDILLLGALVYRKTREN